MKAGDTYRGIKAMRNTPELTIDSIENGIVRISTRNGKSYMAREKLQNNIDMGLLVKVS